MPNDTPLTLLGGLSAAQFMRRHWQKKPLLVRGAIPGMQAPLSRRELFELAARESVESRLVQQGAKGWKLGRGPFARLPALKQAAWTLLVQGVDLHDERAHRLLRPFGFIPAARLDDLMISYATDGGGVGPHFDSYDVFLVQAHGKRRWRYGRQKDLRLRDDVPLKILADFRPEFDEVLEPGDMLYLPPQYAHDGIALGECMTCSVGFRVPRRGELARELLLRLADEAADVAGDALYSDASQPAAASSAAIPETLMTFAKRSVELALRDPHALARSLGEVLTEPKPDVWFEAGVRPRRLHAVRLDRRSRMLHDARHIFINGESWRAAGRDATLMRRLADDRMLDGRSVAGASPQARELLASWCEAGWLHETGEGA